MSGRQTEWKNWKKKTEKWKEKEKEKWRQIEENEETRSVVWDKTSKWQERKVIKETPSMGQWRVAQDINGYQRKWIMNSRAGAKQRHNKKLGLRGCLYVCVCVFVHGDCAPRFMLQFFVRFLRGFLNSPNAPHVNELLQCPCMRVRMYVRVCVRVCVQCECGNICKLYANWNLSLGSAGAQLGCNNFAVCFFPLIWNSTTAAVATAAASEREKERESMCVRETAWELQPELYLHSQFLNGNKPRLFYVCCSTKKKEPWENSRPLCQSLLLVPSSPCFCLLFCMHATKTKEQHKQQQQLQQEGTEGDDK